MPENDQARLEASENLASRQKHVETADAENRIDGIFRDTRTDGIFQAYVGGEIAAADLVPKLKTLLETS